MSLVLMAFRKGFTIAFFIPHGLEIDLLSQRQND